MVAVFDWAKRKAEYGSLDFVVHGETVTTLVEMTILFVVKKKRRQRLTRASGRRRGVCRVLLF